MHIPVLGAAKRGGVHAAMPFCSVLRAVQAEGTGNAQHRVDR